MRCPPLAGPNLSQGVGAVRLSPRAPGRRPRPSGRGPECGVCPRFVLFNAVVRLALALYERDLSLLAPWRILPALLIGLVFDAGVATASWWS